MAITAARTFGTLPEMKDVDQKPEVEKADKVTPATGEKHAARLQKPADLLAEAKKMSGDDASVVRWPIRSPRSSTKSRRESSPAPPAQRQHRPRRPQHLAVPLRRRRRGPGRPLG